jgi:hypothetical protein
MDRAVKSTLRKLLLLSLIHVVLLGALFAYASHNTTLIDTLDSAEQMDPTEQQRVGAAIKRVNNAKALALIVGISYLLGIGTLVAFKPISLISGNLLVILYMVLLLEGATHLLGLRFPAFGHPSMSGTRGLWIYESVTGWFHAPGATAENYVSGPDRGRIRINSLGLRGKDISLDRGEKLRVLVFGDSFVFGVGVDEPHLMTSRLEHVLSPLHPDGVEVINMGVPGYSTDQEYLLWDELGTTLEPYVVVLVVCGNDFVMNSQDFVYGRYYKPFFELDDSDNLTLRNVPVPRLTRTQRAKVWLCQESNLWNFVRSRQSRYPTMQVLIDAFQVDVSRPPRRPYKTTRALLRRFSSSVEQRGAHFLVTNTGAPGGNAEVFESLAKYLDEQRIHNVDFCPELRDARQREPDRLWVFPNNPHWNRDGHRLAAQVVGRYIQENFLRNVTAH